jgi:hypothetical protein
MDLINIVSVTEFVSFDGMNAYDGRVKYILKLVFSKREYLMFKFLCNEMFIDTFLKRYGDRIVVRMIPLSSNAYDHYIEIDERPFFLVGNDEQFKSQFKKEIRDNKIDDLLDEE